MSVDVAKLKVGDRVQFKACTRSDYKKATRVIVAFDLCGRVQVRYHGYGKFTLANCEIIEKVES